MDCKMIGYANERCWMGQVTQAIEDVTEVKRALEAAQGEKKDLQDRFEQRESLIRTSTVIAGSAEAYTHRYIYRGDHAASVP